MSPTPRLAALLAAVAVAALLVPPGLAVMAAAALVVVAALDAWQVRRPPQVERRVPPLLSRGVPGPMTITARHPAAGRIDLRQPSGPDLRIAHPTGAGSLTTSIVGRRRGRHVLPPVAARTVGRLGLGCWYHRAGEPDAIAVYPDMVAAHRVVDAIRRGRLHDSGVRARGRLGLGTEFEYIRNYSPDDDIRRVNWRATARTGRPMSNEYRVDQDRDVIILIDCGRLMAAPLGELTRLDAAVDAATALALVADEVGDRCGVLAFDDAMRARVVPQRAGSWAVIEAILDLEPRPVEADYELAFRRVQAMKRSYVLVLTDIFEPAAARPLLDAVPVLAAKHPVAVASAADLDVAALLDTAPETAADVYRMVVGLDTVQARRTVAARLTAAGVSVIEAPPASLGAACAADYLRAKVRIRL